MWSTETGGEPIHHYQIPGRIQALSLSPDCPVLVSAAGSDVRLDSANDCGYWRTVCETRLPKTVSGTLWLCVHERRCSTDADFVIVNCTFIVYMAGREPDFCTKPGRSVPTGGFSGWRGCLLAEPSGGAAKDPALCLWSSRNLSGCLQQPHCFWGEAHRLGHA